MFDNWTEIKKLQYTFNLMYEAMNVYTPESVEAQKVEGNPAKQLDGPGWLVGCPAGHHAEIVTGETIII